MPQFLLVILLLAVVVVAAYFYLKRAQARTAAPIEAASTDGTLESNDQPSAAPDANDA